MEEYKLYNMERDGKSLKLNPRELNIAVLSKLFHLFPESIVLVSDDGYVETPDEDGDFIVSTISQRGPSRGIVRNQPLSP